MRDSGQHYKTKINFVTRKTKRENFVACEISYVNDAKAVVWKEVFYA